MADRRTFVKTGALTGAGLLLPWKTLVRQAYAQVAGGTLPPGSVTKFLMPLVIPPAMPKTQTISSRGQTVDYYEIAVRQFQQHILPAEHGAGADHGLELRLAQSHSHVQLSGLHNRSALQPASTGEVDQ